MLERLSPARRNLALVLIAALVLWFAWTVRWVLNPFILAYLLAYVLHPLVATLERRGWTRKAAVNVIFITAGALFVLSSFALIAQTRHLLDAFSSDQEIVREIPERIDQGLGKLQTQLVEWKVIDAPAPVAQGAEQVPEQTWSLKSLFAEMSEWLKQRGSEQDVGAAGSRAAGVLHAAQQVFGSVFWWLTLLVLLPLYTYFLMFQLENVHSFVLRYLPYRERDRILRITSQIGEVLSSFFRGRLVVCLLKGLFLSVGLWIAGVPYALLLGFLGGALALIPVVGPLAAFLLAFLLSLLEYEIGAALLRVGIVYALGEVFEGYVLIPKVLGDSLGLHPVVVILSLMIGAQALGLFGLLVALPLTATVVILVRELVLPALKVWAEGPPVKREG